MKSTLSVSLAFILVLLICSETIAYQKAKQTKSSTASSFIGSWEATEDGETVHLVFKSETLLEFDGEESSYKIVPGAIRVTDAVAGQVDYKYVLKGNTLFVTFPTGDQLQFQRIKQGALRSGGLSTQNSTGGRTTGSSAENHLLVGKFMSYSSAGSSSASSSWTTYATFDGKGNFEWSSESAHNTQQYDASGNNTGWGVGYGSNNGNRGKYRVLGDRIHVTFPDGSNDEAQVTERFRDGSIGAFKYNGKTFAR